MSWDKSSGLSNKMTSRTQDFLNPEDLISSLHTWAFPKISLNVEFTAGKKSGSYHQLPPCSCASWPLINTTWIQNASTHHQDTFNKGQTLATTGFLSMILWPYQNLFQKVLAAAQAVEVGCLPRRSLFGIREQTHYCPLCIQLLRWT